MNMATNPFTGSGINGGVLGAGGTPNSGSSGSKKESQDGGVLNAGGVGQGFSFTNTISSGGGSPSGGGGITGGGNITGGGSPSGGVSGGGNQISDNKSFEQANPKSQAEFLNKINPSQVQSQARMADQAQMAAALGLGTNTVPPEIAAAYASGQAFRQTRAEQVARGAKGDATYPNGVQSPLYSENVSAATTKGGNVFIGGVGSYEFKPAPTPTSQLQAPSASNPLFTVGSAKYQPSPMMPKQSIVDVQVPTPFGFMGGIPDVSGRGKALTTTQTGIVVGETSSNPFGFSNTLHGIPMPPEVKQTILMKDMGMATFAVSKQEAWSNYSKDMNAKNIPVQEPRSPVQDEAINMAAALENLSIPLQPRNIETGKASAEFKPFGFLKSSAEGIQATNKPGDVFGNYARDFTGSLIRTPEMIGKTGIAVAGIGKAALTGDVQAFKVGVPASREATIKAATSPEFYVSGIITAGIIGAAAGGKGGYAAKPLENTKFVLNEKTSYSGISTFSKPIVGITTIEGKNTFVVGTPRFGGGKPSIIEMAENRADVNSLAGYNIKKTAFTDYSKASGQPEIAQRFTLTTEAGTSTYYTDIPFSKSLDTMLQAEALKGLPAQAKTNVIGYFTENKGQIVEFYGSFASDVRGASARGFNDIDLHVKSEAFGLGLADAINKGGGKATLQEGMLLVDNVKAFDIKTNTLDVGATTMEGSGEGIGFGFTPKKAVYSPEKYPFMATGEQTVRVGSSLNFLRQGENGKVFLGGSLEKVQRVSDFISLVEKSSEVSGNKKFANFGQQFKPYLNENEVAYFKANPKVAGKLKLYGLPSKAAKPSASGYSLVGGSPSFVSSISGYPSRSASFSPSPSKSASVSPSVSISPSISPSGSPSRSISVSISGYSPYPSPSPSRLVSPSVSPSLSVSPSVSPSIYPSISPSFSPSPSPSPYPSKPPPPPVGFGGFDLGIRDVAGFGGKYKKEKGKYSPSFIAVTLGIRGKPGKSEMSGFAVRPMALAGKKRR